MSATRPDQGQATHDAESPGQGDAHRLTRTQLVVTVAVLFAAGAAVLYALLGPSGVLRRSTGAPAWRPGAAACRADPLAHVHDPGRLKVLANCATVSGLVEGVQYKPGDGDWQVTVAVDPQYRRFLTPAEHGRLPVRVIPADLPYVPLPALGQHATCYGTWVLNKNLHGRAEMHPAWRIAAASAALAGRAPGGAAGSPAGRGHLALKVTAPPAVAVGAPFTLQVQSVLVLPKRTVHASLVHLFIEITSSRGVGVRWQARSTNLLGKADFSLVALDAPGRFAVHIYASKSGLFRSTEQSLVVRRT
jgi:hypothetical protein